MIVALEQQFQQSSSGDTWTSSPFGNAFWERYLEVFDSVVILARTELVDEVESNAKIVGSERIRLAALPFYQGPLGYLLNIRAIRTRIRDVVGQNDAIIVRLPGPIGSALVDIGGKGGRPWGAEIVGDPYDVFAPGAVRHPLRPGFRTMFTRTLRRQARQAAALAYVSRGSLQARYPAGLGTFVTSYSSIALHDDDFVNAGRPSLGFVPPFECTLVGSLEQMYKGVDVLLGALKDVRDRGLDARLAVIGDGRHRAELEDLAADLDMADSVTFTGFIGDRDVLRTRLDRTDLFVLPSRTEGLPRAMIEAMARAVPCAGTSVGGIPELLEPDEMVPPGDPIALADLMYDIVSDPGRMESMSKRNFEKAKAYRNEILQERRQRFYMAVRELTEQWNRSKEKK